MIRSDLALAALATAAVPGMRPVSVAAIRSGEDNPLHQSALVEDVTGRTWVVRSPLSPAAGAELERNDDLIRQLGKHLPFKVPAAAGYADLGQDGRAAVYPYVEGRALSLRHLPVGPGLASAVGRAIAAVHNMPRELFEEFAVPVFDAREFRDRKLSELDRAAETGHVPNGLLARWEQALDAAALWQFATVPTHGSLDGESFLVVFSDEADAASGRVVGLTGWERAQVADPAEDFARLVELANPRAVDVVFDSYAMARSQRPDGYLLSRARLASEMRLLHGLAAAVGSGDEQFVRLRSDELRKLDRLTTNDDSLIPRTALAPPVVEAEPEPVADGGREVSPADTVAEATVAEDTAIEGTVAGGPGVETLTDGRAGAEDTVDDAGADDADADAGADDADTHAGADNADATDAGEATDPVGVADEEAAFEVEPPAEGTHLEPAKPPDSRVSPADVTAPLPMFRPVTAATASDPDPGSAEAGTTVGEPPGAGEAEPTEAGEAAPLEVAEPDVEKSDARGELTDTDGAAEEGAPEPDEIPGPAARDEELPAGGNEDPAEHHDTQSDDDNTTSDDDTTTSGEPEAVADEDTAAQERADRAAEEERLHTIYGMPEAADLESPDTLDR